MTEELSVLLMWWQGESYGRGKTLYDLAELFKVFGDSTRIKILSALFQSEMSGTSLWRWE